MEYEVTVVDRRGRPSPMLIQAGPAATVGALRDALGEEPRGAALFLGAERLSDDRRLADTGLVIGGRLTLGQPAVGRGGDGPAPSPVREVAVVGGPAAGASALVAADGSPRTLVLGRAVGCDLVLGDPEVSRRHAAIRWDGAGEVTVADRGSRNGTGSRGRRITEETRLDDGDLAQLGESLVVVRRYPVADTQLETDPALGVRRFNRPPRIVHPQRQVEVSVPAAPEQPKGIRFPLATVLLPLLLAGVIFLVLPNSGYYLIFLAFAPLMAVAHVVTERRGGRREYREKLRDYRAGLAQARERLAALTVSEEHTSRELLPDPAAVLRIATGPTGRLFERRPADPDFGLLRIGLTERPAAVRLTGPGAAAETVPTAHDVPVTVPLGTAGVLGLAGPRGSTMPILRALLTQVATLHAPHDLGLVLLTGHDEATEWEWLSWLPHTVPHRADLACRRMVATDRQQAEHRIAELRRIMEERLADRQAGLRDQAPPGRRLLVIVDGARRLRTLPGLADLLTSGPAAGLYALCLDTVESSLPDECRATVVVTGAAGTRVRVLNEGREPQPDVLADGLSGSRAARVSRALAPVRVLGARFGDDGDLPDQIRFLDLVGLGPDPTAQDVVERWAAQPSGRTTTVLIGADATGPVTVDLRRDGPHALIAGTSGAGKSELLQTLVASLALGNAPDALNLVLVDYKGGSAFADCRDLPHCVGMITDLDGHLADRALASLTAELRRREGILAEAGAKDIEDYWAGTGGRLPRLVIVVDEFATLVEEVPEFVTGVVGIGMRGRSLGVHVVLATQRPGGVVNAEMRANVNLRLCLRVTRAEESADVVDVPDAARISRLHPGRAYLRTGHADLTMVQAARIGWPRAAGGSDLCADQRVTATPRRVADLGRPRAGDRPEPDPAAGIDGHAGETDLTVLVAAIRAAAQLIEVAAPSGPWLPPLPDRITLAELGPTVPHPAVHHTLGGDPTSRESPVAVPLGLGDHPSAQTQSPFLLDLDRTGPVVIAGMARSGRSTALRALAVGLTTRNGPADVHLYALDHGGRALAPLAALPHCGAWVEGEEHDRTGRLLDLLDAEVARRTRLLAAGGYTALREQRAAAPTAERLPYLVLLVDRYEAFLAQHGETDGGRLVESLDRLLRRGSAVGVLPVLTTDRSGFGHRLGSAVATRLVLRQADPEDVAVFGADPRGMPRTMPDGRAVAVPSGTEVQIALLAPDPDGAAQAAAVERLAAAAWDRCQGLDPATMPRRIDPLPASVTLAELAELRAGAAPVGVATCTVGVGGDHLRPIDLDLAETGATFLVAGPPMSGRSTALLALVTSLGGRRSGDLPVLVCCPRRSPLMTGLAELPGVVRVLRGAEIDTDLADAVAELAGPVAVVVDDAELLGEGHAADVLEQLARSARDHGNLVLAAGTTEELAAHRYRGWLSALRRGRHGLLLNPSSYVDGEVFDLKLPRSTRGGWPAGRALLVSRGTTLPVQVPVSGSDVQVVGESSRTGSRPWPPHEHS
ncbi:DNA segregation ATPase FtsK/SpoIIIE, S-DNA-T family [Micromonospora matsumotoense]|uniref:DNA segregation ATPase FtsK/SpoIIIE, S-DNA-T family n=1 Tax=Micromonospora matsumotoense TaxID=121616 RepID=A0A1C5A9X7_9ACTN|nr:DNA segregation ATPase FtsK/SpoIIIE, S-DNA-T family [Micromonospora matsumotoense]